jgi:hypothetical protein
MDLEAAGIMAEATAKSDKLKRWAEIATTELELAR